MKQQRVEYMDTFRGLGILAMIMGHVWFGKYFDHFIHGFHMQMFFFISGFFYIKKSKYDLSTKSFLIKKVKGLLVPYSFWGIFHYILWLYRVKENGNLKPLMHLLWDNSKDLPIAGALWFLTALFFTETIYFIVDRYIQNGIVENVIFIGLALTGNVWNIIIPFKLPWSLGTALVGVGLYHIGHLIGIYENSICLKRLLNLKWQVSIILGIVTVFFIMKSPPISMREGEYGNVLFFWVNAFLAIVVGINISKYICNIQNGLCFVEIGNYLIRQIGKNSIVYVCLNQLVIQQMYDFVGIFNMHQNYIVIDGLSASILVLGISMIILYILEQILCRTKLKVLVGR